MRFRKKPVVIEAIQYLSDEDSFNSLIRMGCPLVERNHTLEVQTLEGTYRVTHGDWIIKGVKGEFYPCKPDIFEMTYEKEDV